MDKKAVLLALLQLEQYRLKVQKNEIKSTANDFTIRCCQAELASNFFTNRNDWTKILKNEYGLVY
ncbi:uncharacterized protein CBO05P1_238 [Clostridium botulinum B str. Osaka05]|uniref:Uncharacterized protein n=1 Tax=Clostridium botulinum B str. Osaka05 TaxID=1407017 RepID=A0A060N518_CLOBO|nr:hypothetical protein [Clostridium botulinum]BAO04957.1 uncharacterized protein CBO05P1_238 [Clostridium botulinum B str. Osaka05]